MKTLIFLQKNLIWSIPAFMSAGLIVGAFWDTSILKSAITPLTFLMVYPMMVNLNFKQVFSGSDLRLQITVQALNFLLMPLFGFLIGKLFFPEQQYAMIGILLTALLPTSGMTISWTGFARGNLPAAVKMTVVGLVLGSVLTPVYLRLFLGATADIPLSKFFLEIAFIVFLPMALGFATQRLLSRWPAGGKSAAMNKQKFPPFSTLGVLLIVFVAMSLKSQAILSQPSTLLVYAAPVLILYAVNFGLSTLVGKYFFVRGDGIAFVYGSAMRNLSIALAIAMTVFKQNGSDISLIIAIAYIIQVQAGAWYVRFTDRIFGIAE